MRVPITAVMVLSASLARANPGTDHYPGVANTGSAGYLMLPSAQPLRLGSIVLASELGVGQLNDTVMAGPGPLAIGVGLPALMELSVSMRQLGLPRDRPRDSGTLRLAWKMGLFEGGELWPAFALEAWADHITQSPVAGGRLLVSSRRSGGIQVGLGGGFHSGRAGAGQGPDFGAAVSFLHDERWEWLADISVEGERPWSVLAGAALRYQLLPHLTINVGLQWSATRPAGLRAVVGLGLHALSKEKEPEIIDEPARRPKRAPRFTTDQPRFRMKVPVLQVPGDTGYRPLQPEVSPDAEADDLEVIIQEEPALVAPENPAEAPAEEGGAP